MDALLEDELTLGLVKTKGVAYFVNYIKGHGDLPVPFLQYSRPLPPLF